MNVKIIDHSTTVLNRLADCIKEAQEDMKEDAIEWAQEQMLFGYSTPHGKDGHTEIYETGHLSDDDSFTVEVKRDSQNTFTLSLGSVVDYAGYVHNGTYKLEGRPFITDALVKHQEDQKNIYLSHLKRMNDP